MNPFKYYIEMNVFLKFLYFYYRPDILPLVVFGDPRAIWFRTVTDNDTGALSRGQCLWKNQKGITDRDGKFILKEVKEGHT